jgi:hypothetical protein
MQDLDYPLSNLTRFVAGCALGADRSGPIFLWDLVLS